jgi:hypothetical protein
MLNQPDQVTQSTATPEELRQVMLDTIDVEQKAIEELSDEELEMVAGGLTLFRQSSGGSEGSQGEVFHDAQPNFPPLDRLKAHYGRHKGIYQAGAASVVLGTITGTLGGFGL